MKINNHSHNNLAALSRKRPFGTQLNFTQKSDSISFPKLMASSVNINSIQANLNIKFTHKLAFLGSIPHPLPDTSTGIKKDLDTLLECEKITQQDYNSIINGTSEVSSLLANEPYSMFSDNFERYLHWLLSRQSSLLTTLVGDSFIFHYAECGSVELNRALRNGDNLNSEFSTVKIGLTNALEKLPNLEGTVYRGRSSFNESSTLKTGDIYNPKEFLSTSTEAFQSFQFGLKHKFVIKSKTGKHIDSISCNSGEQEVLFNCGSKFRVLAIDEEANGGKTYFMEEVKDADDTRSNSLSIEQLNWVGQQRKICNVALDKVLSKKLGLNK